MTENNSYIDSDIVKENFEKPLLFSRSKMQISCENCHVNLKAGLSLKETRFPIFETKSVIFQ